MNAFLRNRIVPFFAVLTIQRVLLTIMVVLLCALHMEETRGEPSGLGLLKGAEASRLSQQCLEMSFLYTMENNPPIPYRIYLKTPLCLIDQDAISNGANGILPYSTVLVKENEMIRYIDRLDKHAAIYDLPYVQSNVITVAFDPRILGLCDYMAVITTVTNCLQYEYGGEVSVEEKAEHEGRTVWVVRVKDEDADNRYWIEEPSFRIHRVTRLGLFGQIDIRSYYDNDNTGPLPSRIMIRRNGPQGELELDRKIDVTNVKYNQNIPDSFFDLKSMRLPLNTEVVDYRVQQRLGYWDGEKLVERYVKMSAQEQREWEERMNRQPLSKPVRYILTAIGLLMVIYALFAKFREWRRGRSSEQ